jgi:Ras family
MSSKVDSNDDENRKQQQIPVIDDDLPDPDLKIILLGDSAVGKSKLVERFLMDEYNPRQLSTYALTLFRKKVTLEDTGEEKTVDFWDTAGQESFNRMHPSYYYRAHCCILVFDVTRKVTYQHLADWLVILLFIIMPFQLLSFSIAHRDLSTTIISSKLGTRNLEPSASLFHAYLSRTKLMLTIMSRRKSLNLLRSMIFHFFSSQQLTVLM